jgi:hypothetical protein
MEESKRSQATGNKPYGGEYSGANDKKNIDLTLAGSIATTADATTTVLYNTYTSIAALAASLTTSGDQEGTDDSRESQTVVDMKEVLKGCALGHYLTKFDVRQQNYFNCLYF